MNHVRLYVLLLLWSCAQAEDIYQIRPLSEKELLQTYTTLLRDACQHADQFWTNSTFDPHAGHWGSGISGGNEGIRAISEIVLTCGALLKYSDALNEAERKEYT